MGTMPSDTLRASLEARRRQLDEEIRAYPTPIPRCDAQFNFLMEERSRIVRELEALG
ncbi:MAG: hypothetical protein ABIQ84_08455 [Usitatibacter sp.]